MGLLSQAGLSSVLSIPLSVTSKFFLKMHTLFALVPLLAVGNRGVVVIIASGLMLMKGHQRVRERFVDIVASRRSSIRFRGRRERNTIAVVSL
jgi:hypothetical protein